MTTRKPTPIKPVVYGVADLQRVTGLGRDLVKACIRTGHLPGFVVGDKPLYVVPTEAFEDFIHGRWQPNPRPVLDRPVTALVHRKAERREA